MLTERYVRADAAGGGDGTTDTNSGPNGAFTWAEMVADLNTPRVGYRYNVKQGTYNLSASSVLTGDGTTTSPNVIRGFKDTPGDATIGRGSDGLLNVSNMPTINYTSSAFRFDASGANYLILESLNFTGNAGSALVFNSGTGSLTIGCKATSTQTGTGAVFENGGNGTNMIIGCDAYALSSGSAMEIMSAPGGVIGCKVFGGSAGTGINLRNNSSLIAFNTIKGAGNGINKNTAGAVMNTWFNTISGCAADGINFAAASTARTIMIGNHITGCGGWGIDLNGTTVDTIVMMNRFRNNVSGNINGGTDWSDATRIMEILTAGSDAADFVDSVANNFALDNAAPAFQKALLFQLMNIGANGSSLTGGGGLSGFSLSRLVQ